jgi:hypothetical protein
MPLQKSKQINKLLNAPFYVAGYPYPAAASSNVTAALTTAAATAGDGGVAVPVQPASAGVEGFLTDLGSNRLEVYGTGVTTVALVGDTDGSTAVVTNIASTTTVVLGMVLGAALGGIPAGAKVLSKTATSVTFDNVSTAVVVAGAFTVKTKPGEQKLIDANGNEVYGLLTQAAGVYTLALYSLVNGIETSFAPAAAVTIDFVPIYCYTFDHLDKNALLGGTARFVGQDPVGSQRTKAELLTVTGINTLSALSTPYVAGGEAWLHVNGDVTDMFAPAAFTIVGTTVTWNQANAGFALAPGDRVVAKYAY